VAAPDITGRLPPIRRSRVSTTQTIYTCERLFGYRNALVERVSIEISKAKTKKTLGLSWK
jgi:hypothetical protein